MKQMPLVASQLWLSTSQGCCTYSWSWATAVFMFFISSLRSETSLPMPPPTEGMSISQVDVSLLLAFISILHSWLEPLWVKVSVASLDLFSSCPTLLRMFLESDSRKDTRLPMP